MFELKKIGFIKRASALLLDAILLAVLTTGLMFVISLICNYGAEEQKANDYYNQWDEFRINYIADLADYYDGFIYEESDEGRSYTVTKDGEKSSLDELINTLVNDENRDDTPLLAEAYSAFEKLPSATKVNQQYQYVYTLLFMMISIGVLLAYLILEFIIPLFLKNGQTVGKKIFAIGLVRPNGVKITNMALFARTVIGKFAIETMFPILLVFLFLFGGIGWLAIVLFAAITLLNVIMFFVTKNRTPIHDSLAGTVAVDIKLQRIFQSEEELAEAKSKDFIQGSKS